MITLFRVSFKNNLCQTEKVGQAVIVFIMLMLIITTPKLIVLAEYC